jgi:hypothetical protein
MRKLYQFKLERFLVPTQTFRKNIKRRLYLHFAVWIRARILHLLKMDLNCIDVTDPRIQTKELKNSSQFEFVVVNSATLHVLSGAIFSNIKEIPATMLAQSSIWDPIYGMNDFGIVPKNPPKYDGSNLNIMAVPKSRNYFHWVIDYLPFIIAAKMADKEIKYICSETLTQYQLDSLSWLNIEPELISHSDWILTENVVLPKRRHLSGSPTIQTVDFLRESYRSLASDSGLQSSRLYVSRRFSSRALQNEVEIEKILEQNGFEILYLERLTFKEQIQKFASSEIIIAPHGAGLTNILWCKEGTKVVEVTSPSVFNPCYRNLSNQIQLNHSFISGEWLFEFVRTKQF